MESIEWLRPIVVARFRTEVLDRDPSSIVAIAPDGRIGWANEGWFRFARANGGESAAIGIGANYFASIGGAELRRDFHAAVTATLSSGEPFEMDYECSSAAVYRAYHLRMLPLSGRALLLVHSPIAERPHDRPAEPPDEARYRDALGMIAQCTNCRRVRAPVELSWHWVPAWVEANPAGVTHVLCPVCKGFYWPRSTARE
jgi:hypothetical protein